MMWIFCLMISQAFASPFSDAPFEIRGYKKSIGNNTEKIEIKASGAKGFGDFSFEELVDAEIKVTLKELVLQFKSKKALFKKDEIIFYESVELKIKDQKTHKIVVDLKSILPDDRLWFSLKKATLKIPKSSLQVGGETIERRSAVIDLVKRSILWVGAPHKLQRKF